MVALSISRKLRHRSEQLFDRRDKTRTDGYAYNTRSELTEASLGASPYAYDYDNIGNRKTAQEIAQESTYAANTLNQYSAITRNQAPFTPTFDPDGNQTLVQTSTGIWKVTYNADSRPVRFTQQGGTTSIDCGYDYMGRRYEKKITVNGAITLHQHYLYRGYLQIAALDKKRTHLPALWYTHWDPTEPTATRPLSIRKNGTWYTYGCDLTKNVQELFTATGAIATTYDYTPFGSATRQGAFDQPFQWSSEVNDVELALTYYNYRHYNPMDGRWINRDPIAEQGGVNLYAFVGNNGISRLDRLGLWRWPWSQSPPSTPRGCTEKGLTEPNAQQKQKCEQFQNQALQDSRVSELMERLRRGNCEISPFVCKCCSGGCLGGGAWHFHDKIVLCTNGNQGRRNTPNYILHELTHRLQKCEGREGEDCLSSLKNEVEAYKTSQPDCAKAIELAKSSAVLGTQCREEEITDEMMRELMTYCQSLH